MRKLLKAIVPSAARHKVRALCSEQNRADRVHEWNRIPHPDLEERNVANARLVATRARMIALLPRGGVAAEIGVSRGKFTAAIMAANPPRKLHLVDVWASDRYNQTLRQGVEQTYAAEIAAGSVEINLGYSIEVGRSFPDAYFDWIYLDTDHSYPTTRDELAVYESKMKPGGIIAGHDYVMGNWRSSLKFGVIEAVTEFCIARNWELLYVTTEQTTNASFAIRKIGGA
ncbi:MAG TPA: class I SAM-dependent methyltransferase [Gemmatimonadaceae bacterium]